LGLLLSESSGTWATGVEAALPANAGSNPDVSLFSVSCASAGDCSAVGNYLDSADNFQGLLLGSVGLASPAITDLSVRAGPIAGGTSVVITGSGFGNPGDADTVTFVPQDNNGPRVPAVDVTVKSDSEIDLVTPAMPAIGVLYTNVQVTDADGSASAIGPSGQFNFPATVVEMGDSIAAGEGTLDGFTYSGGASTGLWSGGVANAPGQGPYPECHDSPFAYGQVLSGALGANFVNLACTGASYAHGLTGPEVFQNYLSSNVTVPAQFPSLAYDEAEPDAVVMTYGADDVQFSSIAKECIASALASSPLTKSIVIDAALDARSPEVAAILAAALAGPEQCTLSNPGSMVENDFYLELSDLSRSYGQIVTAIENRGAAASPSRVPKIIFTDYMDPFPPDGVGCADTWPLDNAQLSYFNTLFAELNSTMRHAVLGLDDPDVSFVDISGALTGHTWCTDHPWDYGLSVSLQGGQILNALSASPSSDAPFHATPEGQAAMADLVRPVVATALGVPDTGPAVTSAAGNGGGSADGVTAQPGDPVSLDAAGFAPDETVDETLHSTPVPLGSVTADGSGNVSATVTIPVSTPAGPHELLLTGETSGLTATLPVLVPAPMAPPVFTTDSPPLTVPSGLLYTGYFGAAGVPSPTYALAPGAPAWLSLDPSFAGIVSGAPPAGTTSFTFSVLASNGVGPIATAGPFTVTVTPAGGLPAGSGLPAGPAPPAGSGSGSVAGSGHKPSCKLTVKTDNVLVPLKTRAHKGKTKPHTSPGTLALTVKCDQAATTALAGKLVEQLEKNGKHGSGHTKTLRLGPIRGSVRAGVVVALTVKLPGAAISALERKAKESVTFTLNATNANGTSLTTAKNAKLKPVR
jgi:hypothetical protein